MEAATGVLSDVSDWAVAWFSRNVLTENNGWILFATWIAIQVLGPIVNWLVTRPFLVKHRLPLYGASKTGKRYAAMIWCSALMWFPTAQPELCGPGVTDWQASGCQMLFHRLTLGPGLGLFLSFVHWLVWPRILKKLGIAQNTVKTVCINCRKTVKVQALDDPCPECAAPTHQVTDATRTLA